MRARRLRSTVLSMGWAVAAVALAWTPATLEAQAICSAPHSSPTLAQSGAVRGLPPGAGWVQLSVYGQRATEAFNQRGDRQPFLANSTFDTRSLYLTGAYGVTDGLEVWGQLPVHSLGVDGDGGATTSDGLGDLRGAVRLTPRLFDLDLPVALRAGLKVPGSEFPVDATVLPLTEGQIDFELSVESGWAADELPVYLVGWIGYRWRGPDEEVSYEPGDERFAHAAVGGTAGPLHLELGLDGLWGGTPIQQGVPVPAGHRRLIQLLPTVGTDVGPGRLELTVPVPVSGKNLPSSPGFSLGFRTAWGL